MAAQTSQDRYVDCNVMVGFPPSGVRVACANAEDLLREMDWIGVEEALVYHAVMAHGSPIQGNQLVLDAVAQRPRLHPTWALLPPCTEELGSADALLEAMRDGGVRALWAFPREHHYVLNRLTMGSLLDEVATRRIPLLVPRGQGWNIIAEVLADYPDLTLVAVGHGPWGEDRFFRPLLERYPRLYLDISRYELLGGVAELVDRYGAERLLYGSGYPYWGMGGPRLMLARAAVSEGDRALIAGGNLKRLLEEAEL